MPDSTTQTPDLVASTGINDPNSIYNSGLLQSAISLGENALTSALNLQTPTGTAAAAPAGPVVQPPGQAPLAAAPAPAHHQTMWIIAGIALVAVWVFFRGK